MSTLISFKKNGSAPLPTHALSRPGALIPFNEDGPVSVSQEDFETFQNLKQLEFDQGYYTWLNENNRDGIRRLIIRVLLRQSYGENQPIAIIYYQTKHGFGRLTSIGGGETTENLYWTLRNRPKLRDEIVSELLYNLEHSYMPQDSFDKECLQELLELLMTVTDIEDAKQLWQYHPLKSNTRWEAPKFMTERLRLYANYSYMPQFIRDELWNDIKNSLSAAIEKQKKALLEEGIPYISSNRTMQSIINFIDTIKKAEYHSDHNSLIMITNCLRLLEDKLPQTVTYFDCSSLELITIALNDKALACEVLCRHIVHITTETLLIQAHKNFLYSAYGIISVHAPERTDCLDKLKAIFPKKVDYEIVDV